MIASVALFFSLGGAGMAATSTTTTAPRICKYPTLVVWTSGGFLNAEQGKYASYPCPSGAHPAHHLIVTRHRGRVTITMAPGSAPRSGQATGGR